MEIFVFFLTNSIYQNLQTCPTLMKNIAYKKDT
jgi:hypothetical protein